MLFAWKGVSDEIFWKGAECTPWGPRNQLFLDLSLSGHEVGAVVFIPVTDEF